MALMMCAECGQKVSDKAATCPGCGVKIKKKSSSSFLKVVLGLAFIGILGNIAIRPRHPGTKLSDVDKVAKPAADVPTADDLCRDRGSNIARAYFANMSKAMELNMMPSQMMEDGCKQAMGSRGNECVNLCMDGFRYEAKIFVKSGGQ